MFKAATVSNNTCFAKGQQFQTAKQKKYHKQNWEPWAEASWLRLWMPGEQAA